MKFSFSRKDQRGIDFFKWMFSSYPSFPKPCPICRRFVFAPVLPQHMQQCYQAYLQWRMMQQQQQFYAQTASRQNTTPRPQETVFMQPRPQTYVSFLQQQQELFELQRRKKMEEQQEKQKQEKQEKEEEEKQKQQKELWKQQQQVKFEKQKMEEQKKQVVSVSQKRKGIPLWTDFHYQNYLQGKSVVLVGPSDCSFGFGLGEWIDQQDVVIRCNKSLPVPQEHIHGIGSKTNLLYNNLNTTDFPGQNRLDAGFLEMFHLDGLISPYPAIEPFQKDIIHYQTIGSSQIPLRVMDPHFYQQVYKVCQSRPYTGIMAIMDVLRYPIRQLYVTGMDFYHTGYYRGYRTMQKSQRKQLRKNEIHDAEKQERMLRWVYLRENRLSVDPILQKILLEPWLKWFQKARTTMLPWIEKQLSVKSIFEKRSYPFFEMDESDSFQKHRNQIVEMGIWFPFSFAERQKYVGNHSNSLINRIEKLKKNGYDITTWMIPIFSYADWNMYHTHLGQMKVHYFMIQESNHGDVKKILAEKTKDETVMIFPSSMLGNPSRMLYQEEYASLGEGSRIDLTYIWCLMFFIWIQRMDMNSEKMNKWNIRSPFEQPWNGKNMFQHTLRALCKLEWLVY